MAAGARPPVVSQAMTLDDLLAAGPEFQTAGDGWTSWALSTEALRFLDQHLAPGMRTLETGEGVSTVLFALRGTNHLCVTPSRRAVAKIRDFCARNGISTGTLEFDERPSQVALPSRDLGSLDVVLVDGGHGFPIPFLDWLYAGQALGVGGLLVVDDVHLWTGAVLRDFLDADPGWVLVAEYSGRTVVYRRLTDAPLAVEWTEQPFVVARSQPRASTRAERLAELVRQRRFGALARRGARFGAARLGLGSRRAR